MPNLYTLKPELIKSNKAVIRAGWNDAPWLSEQAKKQMWEDTPPHLRKARSEGIPGLGSGSVYPIHITELLVEDFKIPDFYKRIYALDVGWDKTAALFGALNPDDDVLYLFSEHYVGNEEPYRHAMAIRERFKAAGYEFYGFIDPAARGRSQVDGQKLIDIYRRDHGLKVIPAKNEVESGVYRVYERASARRLKIFKSLINTQNEWATYQRDLNGKIVKKRDHLMDCLRYMVASLDYAKARPQHNVTSGELGYGGRKYNI